MAQASRQVRKIRRIKRERTLAYKGMDLALSQRDQARMIASAMEMELKKHEAKAEPETPVGNTLTKTDKGSLTITRIPEETEPVE